MYMDFCRARENQMSGVRPPSPASSVSGSLKSNQFAKNMALRHSTRTWETGESLPLNEFEVSQFFR